ncbi:MAG: hypothetical protein JWM32_2056 [Verrucomicrobia bacterium]|nr:hypothetical protein [Verrucomicrobiota bacterium]
MAAPATVGSLVPALVLPFIAWRIYRRFHRNVGKQPLHRGRLITGIVVFGLISALLVAASIFTPHVLAGFGGGLALGLPLAWLGLKLTRFETDASGRHFYTPNTYIGIGLTLLLAGRVVYRLLVLYDNSRALTSTPPNFMQSPLTMVIIGLTAGYYITFNSGVLIKAGKL